MKLMYSYVCKRSIRPRNINWQDWKYTYFEIFVCLGQNIQRHSGMGGEYFVADVVENIRLKFQNNYFYHAINRKYLCRINVQKRFKLMQNITFNSDVIMFLIKMKIHP